MSGVGQSPARHPAPERSLRRSISALVFLYAVAFVVAVLTGAKCQGDAPWRVRSAESGTAAPVRK